jgi:exonuclease SbcD
MLVPQLRVFGTQAIGADQDIWVSFQPYTNAVDINNFGYSYSLPEKASLHIHIAHGMLMDHIPPFDRYSLVQNIETNADIVLTGHCHTGYGVYKRKDGKIFCNPGSLLRSSASAGELERPIQVAVIDTQTKDIQLVPLKCAKPGNDVLDRSKIEADERREYAMSEFAALIQTGTGEKALLDIDNIVETIAKQDKLPAEVVKKTLEKISEMKGLVT